MTADAPSPVVLLQEDTADDRAVLGGKAASIRRMMALGIPVPPAFVITTEVCRRYHGEGRRLPDDVWARVPAAVTALGAATGKEFGDGGRPLLVSVRSGAATSMPGMMDTVLNLGMTDRVERALAARTADAAFAVDTRRRFEEQFERVVGAAPPDDPWEQLRLAVVAVLESWSSRRARRYRAERGIPDHGGTAVTVQAMVFGNLDDRSGTGVLFTRDPIDGSPRPYGEWLPRGQGEDVVSGRADALPLAALAASLPRAHADLLAAASLLEREGRDVQDIEFTVECGTVWLLQSRTARSAPEAAVRHAVAFAREGLIGVPEALDRVDPGHVRALLTPRLDTGRTAATPVLAAGKPASPGMATGIVVTDVDEAEDRADRGEAVILARPTTEPDDVAAMSVSAAVVTELGGSTSHAAVVCRELAIPCVVGCGAATVSALAGRTVTVDATTGTVYAGTLLPVTAAGADDPDVAALAGWLDAGPGATAALPDLLRRRRAARTRARTS